LRVKALNQVSYILKKFFPIRTFEWWESFGCHHPFIRDRGSDKFFAEIEGENRCGSAGMIW